MKRTPVPTELVEATEFAKHQPAPDFLAKRVGMLKEFVHSAKFPRSRDDKYAALDEIVFLKRELIWARYVQMRVKLDREAWENAVLWVRADASETEADLIETLMLSVPRRPKESDARYLARLQAIRHAFAASMSENAPE